MAAQFPNTLACAALLTLVAVLTDCAPTNASGNARSKEASMSDESKTTSSRPYYQVELLDVERQLYRYDSGTCRELGKLPSPWRKYESKRYEKPGEFGRFPTGYDWGPGSNTDATEVTLEAEYAPLGVPPANTLPGTIRRSGLSQDVALLSLGQSLEERPHWMHRAILEALSAALPDWHAGKPIPFQNRWGESRVFVPMKAPFPVSDHFGVYVEDSEYVNEKTPLMIINPPQRAGVYCDSDFNWPNPSCIGLILLGEDEVATIDVNYEALGTLQEVVASMTHAAHAIRVDCPADGVTP